MFPAWRYQITMSITLVRLVELEAPDTAYGNARSEGREGRLVLYAGPRDSGNVSAPPTAWIRVEKHWAHGVFGGAAPGEPSFMNPGPPPVFFLDTRGASADAASNLSGAPRSILYRGGYPRVLPDFASVGLPLQVTTEPSQVIQLPLVPLESEIAGKEWATHKAEWVPPFTATCSVEAKWLSPPSGTYNCTARAESDEAWRILGYGAESTVQPPPRRKS